MGPSSAEIQIPAPSAPFLPCSQGEKERKERRERSWEEKALLEVQLSDLFQKKEEGVSGRIFWDPQGFFNGGNCSSQNLLLRVKIVICEIPDF